MRLHRLPSTRLAEIEAINKTIKSFQGANESAVALVMALIATMPLFRRSASAEEQLDRLNRAVRDDDENEMRETLKLYGKQKVDKMNNLFMNDLFERAAEMLQTLAEEEKSEAG